MGIGSLLRSVSFAVVKALCTCEIYEGDIIFDTHDHGDRYEVVYEHNGFWMKDREANEYGSGFEDAQCVEVIGNIHENPELLEVDDE